MLCMHATSSNNCAAQGSSTPQPTLVYCCAPGPLPPLQKLMDLAKKSDGK